MDAQIAHEASGRFRHVRLNRGPHKRSGNFFVRRKMGDPPPSEKESESKKGRQFLRRGEVTADTRTYWLK